MFATDDSIVAIATPPGRGGIGIVRLSGPSSVEIAGAILEQRSLRARYATHTRVRSLMASSVIDEVIVMDFPAPHSYTGEHVIEISAHGSPVVLHAIVAERDRSRRPTRGARRVHAARISQRQARPGPGGSCRRSDAASTPLQARVAFDQLEGTLTGLYRGARRTQLFDLIARLEASLDFPDEGYHFIDPRDIRSSAWVSVVESAWTPAGRRASAAA